MIPVLMDEPGESTGGDRPRGGAKAPAQFYTRRVGRALPVLAHGRELYRTHQANQANVA